MASISISDDSTVATQLLFPVSKIPKPLPIKLKSVQEKKIQKDGDGIDCYMMDDWEIETVKSFGKLPPEGVKIWKIRHPVRITENPYDAEEFGWGYTTDLGIAEFIRVYGEDLNWEVKPAVEKLDPADQMKDVFFQYFGNDRRFKHTTLNLAAEVLLEYEYHGIGWPGEKFESLYAPWRVVNTDYDPLKDVVPDQDLATVEWQRNEALQRWLDEANKAREENEKPKGSALDPKMLLIPLAITAVIFIKMTRK